MQTQWVTARGAVRPRHKRRAAPSFPGNSCRIANKVNEFLTGPRLGCLSPAIAGPRRSRRVKAVAEKPKNDAPPDEDVEGVTEDEGQADASSKKTSKLPSKKLMIMAGAPLLLLLLGGLGAYFMGLFDGGEQTVAADGRPVDKKPEKTVFYDLPEMLVNLNSAGRRTNFLKISVSLEVSSDSDVQKLEAVKPRIIDSFQVYLRELRLDDLRGSAGVYRLREELLARVTASAHSVQVKDVLFKEMLVQ